MGRTPRLRRTAMLLVATILALGAPTLAAAAASAEEEQAGGQASIQTIESTEEEEAGASHQQDADLKQKQLDPLAAEEPSPSPVSEPAPIEERPVQLTPTSAGNGEAAPPAKKSIEGGTLSWGISENWRSYITGNIAKGEVLAVAPAILNEDDTVTWVNGSGDVDLAVGIGVFEYAGGLIARGHPGHDGHEWALNQTLSNIRIELTSTTSAKLSAEVVQPLTSYAPEYSGERVEMVDLTFAEGDLLDGQVLASGVFTEDGADIYSRMNNDFQPGAPVDDVRFGIGVEAPVDKRTPTTVSLSADPTTVHESEAVVLTAIANVQGTQAPVAGSVNFNSGDTELGSKKLNTDDGTASLSVNTLAVGDHSITATFIPDSEDYTASTSTSLVVTVVKRSGVGGDSVVGSIEWGIKTSFRDYVVGGIAKGKFTVKDGAKQATGNGVFTYPQAESGKTWDGSTGTVQYTGNVSIWGHHGAMNVNLPNPSIHIKNSSSADLRVPFQGKTITLATIDLQSAVKQNLGGDAVKFVGANVLLSATGAQQVFVNGSGDGPAGTFYEPGETMDKITFTIGEGSRYGLSDEQGGDNTPGRGNSNGEPAIPSAAAASGGGSLTWPISGAFSAYTTCANKEAFGYSHCAKGSIDTSGVGDGYLFPQAVSGNWNKETQTGTVEFSGLVKFNGYGLTMFQVANPSIIVHSDTSATLNTGNNTHYGEASYSLDLSAGGKTVGANGEVTWSNVPVNGTLVGTTTSQAIGLDPLTFTVGDPSTAYFGSTQNTAEESATQASAKEAASRESASVGSLSEAPPVLAIFSGSSGVQSWEWWVSAGGFSTIASCMSLLAIRQRRNAAALLSHGAP